MKRQPISTEGDKYKFLQEFEAEARACAEDKRKEFMLRLAKEMKTKGLYRTSTANVDICTGIRKRFEKLKYWERKQFTNLIA